MKWEEWDMPQTKFFPVLRRTYTYRTKLSELNLREQNCSEIAQFFQFSSDEVCNAKSQQCSERRLFNGILSYLSNATSVGLRWRSLWRSSKFHGIHQAKEIKWSSCIVQFKSLLNGMRYINLRFCYIFIIYLLTYYKVEKVWNGRGGKPAKESAV